MNSILIGIDLGTTGCRSILYDERLNILAEEYIEYPLIKKSNREIEQDANLWWALVKKTIIKAMGKVKMNKQPVKGISISSQGIAFVPVDEDCIPLRNAISWLDTRAKKQLENILCRFTVKELFKRTGKRANEAYVLPKILWLKENERELYDSTYKFLMPHDFIICKLCGKFVTDHTLASGTMLYDINKQEWSKEIFKEFKIDDKKFPEIKWSAIQIGIIKKDVANELGLGENTIVSVGGQDQKCAALGAGISERTAAISLGTASAITCKYDYPVVDNMMRIPCFSDLSKNKWVAEGVLGTGAASLKWLKNTFFTQESYSDIDCLVMKNRMESNVFFYPYLVGSGSPDWYNEACGCFYGINLSTEKSDFVKALYEGIAFKIKSNLDVLEENTIIDKLIIFGGGSKSESWCSIIANITGKTVLTNSSPETASRGAAILAGIGCGVFRDIAEIDELIDYGKVHQPDSDWNKLYQPRYYKYCEIEKKLWDER